MGEEEAEATRNAVITGKLSQGPLIPELERRLAVSLGVPFVMTTTSCSTALVSALFAAGVGPGDEVIVPNRTYIAAAHAAQLIGATVRLVDTIADYPKIDPAKIEEKITDRTRAIIPVHLNGVACDMAAIQEIADRRELVIVEDAAQALFSKHRGQYLGTFGRFGCFSLGVTKFMTSGQGGFVVAHDQRTYERLKHMHFHGVSTSRDEAHEHFGFNFRFSSLQASVALRQLERVPVKIKAHVDLYNRYREVLSGLDSIDLMAVDIEAGELPLWIQVTSRDRNRLVSFLAERGIGTMSTTPNLSESPHLSDISPFPNSTLFQDSELILPSGPDQDPVGIQHTLDALVAFDAS